MSVLRDLDPHTTASSGQYTLAELARRAKESDPGLGCH